MARNERPGNCWSQPRRSTPAKSRSGRTRGLGADDLDGLSGIVSAFECGERRNKYDSWQTNRNSSNNQQYSPTDCCLKNGRVQCSCLWPQNPYNDQQRRNLPFSRPFNRGSLPFKNKSSRSENNASNGLFQDSKMLEEFILDDNDLGLLNYYDIPVDVPRRTHVRNVGKVKTVSIIDTLSELASGATDREDEGGFSSAVSESAVLSRNVYKPRVRHIRQPAPRCDARLKANFGALSHVGSKISSGTTPSSSRPVNNSVKTPNIFHSPQSQDFVDDGNFTCSSLKRTLKYLRKAVASNVTEEECQSKKNVQEPYGEDTFRLCFSDSEVKETSDQWSPLQKGKQELNAHLKSKSLLTVIDPFVGNITKPGSAFRCKTKTTVPEWIKEVFSAAKNGDVERMKIILRDIDPSLVRNLSDDHGNNLWHICAVHNNFECLNWLCSQNQYHIEALKDENKNGFSPVAMAVKHGSLLAVQWLIHNTISKSQITPLQDSRSLLHIAARYGQDSVVEWLLGYMASQNIDTSGVDAEGNTALHLASKYGHIGCIKALVFQTGCLKVRNENGLKPLDLAVKHQKRDCADYLVALESSYNLAALNLRQHADIQHLQKENAEMKSYFKELLMLTKRLQHRQKELIQSFSRANLASHFNLESGDKLNDKNQIIDNYSHLLSTVMSDEEHHLLLIEDRWKKSRKQTKFSDSKRKPLDVLRSQFNHVLEKISNQSPPIPSTPETSDSSLQSEDEECDVKEQPFTDFPVPDVVNTLLSQNSIPFLSSKLKVQKDSSVNIEKTLKEHSTTKYSVSKSSSPSVSSKVPNTRDVNLRMFFKQNPNLRQSGETCSVLEVLEPSSSDSEECSAQKKRSAKYNAEKEAEQSSSSSAMETLSPYSCRPSSSGSKASGSRSSSSGSRQNQFLPTSHNLLADANNTVCERKKGSDETENNTSEVQEKGPNDQVNRDNSISSEPDLIKGTQKKKMQPALSLNDKEKKCAKDPASDSTLADNRSISTEDSESLEADHSFSSTNDVPDAVVSNQSNPEPSNTSTTIKKKSFLLKFALRGRWPSKTAPRSQKNEISPEEFRETYSRSTPVDVIPPTSQSTTGSESLSRKKFPLPKNETEGLPSDASNKETSACSNEKSNDPDSFPVTTLSDNLNHCPVRGRRGLLPPRRDPPPAPPLNVRDDEQSQDHSDDDMSVSVQKSSVSSCVEDCITPSVSLQGSYIGSRSSDLWHSPDSKSLFRPASSASRVDSPSRGEENFPLNKSSSASTEMLSALDSSTAGRQSPAPSEVSKTESALSPPSDVSKTESTRYLSQLGRIEESGHLAAIKASNLQQNDEQNIKENLTSDTKSEPKHKKKSAKKINSDKPWYEFSDEEDVITPQRYKSVSMRSSSEDEGAVNA